MDSEIELQLQRVFQNLGMEPKEIRYNDNVGRWLVSVQADRSDERFHRRVGEVGSEGPVDYALDFTAVKSMRQQIDGVSILAGTVNVETIEDEYYKITIE